MSSLRYCPTTIFAHVEANCFQAIISKQARYPNSRLISLRCIGLPEDSARLIRHRPVGLLLAADCVARRETSSRKPLAGERPTL